MRGIGRPTGHRIKLPNGYVNVKMADGTWRLAHHLAAEEKIGRAIDSSTERVVFVNKDKAARADPTPDDVAVRPKKPKTLKTQSRRQEKLKELEKREARLEEERDEVRAEKATLEELIQEVRTLKATIESSKDVH